MIAQLNFCILKRRANSSTLSQAHSATLRVAEMKIRLYELLSAHACGARARWYSVWIERSSRVIIPEGVPVKADTKALLKTSGEKPGVKDRER